MCAVDSVEETPAGRKCLVPMVLRRYDVDGLGHPERLRPSARLSVGVNRHNMTSGGNCRGARRAAALMALCATIGVVPGVHAQFRGTARRPAAPPLTVARDRDAEAWLRKARDAAASGEWKLLADTLHRVIDGHGANTVALEEDTEAPAAIMRYATARTRAWRILAAAPPAAIETFRLTYEAEAARLLADARTRHDETALRDVVARFLPTRAGQAAADELATWLVDAGRWHEAWDALDLLDAFPDHGVPRWSIELRRAAICLLTDRPDRARPLLDRLRAAPPADAPRDLAERLRAMEALAIAPPTDESTDTAADWPALLGDARRAGRMPAVAPNLFDDSARRIEFSAAEPPDRDEALRVALETGRTPVWQALTDGRTLFVATPQGYSALDPVTLSVRGRFGSEERNRTRPPPPSMNLPRFMGLRRARVERPSMSAATHRALFDEPAGAMAIVNGRVFTIEQPHVRPSEVDDLEAALTGATDELVPNVLAAYDAVTVKLLWSKGGAGPPEDGLIGARFLSTPVRIGARLAALYQLGADLMLLELLPDGTILRRITLGSLADARTLARRVLPMNATEDTLCVQTGMGAILAMNAGDLSLRWVSTYERALQRMLELPNGVRVPLDGDGMLPADGWLQNPPLIRDDLVIVAPPDSNSLIAFDRRDGRPRWEAHCPAARQVVGADARRVYVAGSQIEAFDLADGKRTWREECAGVIGRVALADDRLLVPTDAEILVLDAATGRRLRSGTGRSAAGPFGNLLSWNGALYSVEWDGLRRFGDLTREMQEALDRLRRRPDDNDARLKAASLYAIRGAWRDALDLLDEAAGTSGEDASRNATDAQWTREANRLRVRALLGLIHDQREQARQSGADAVQSELEPLLERAVQIAAHAEDRLAVTLVNADLECAWGRAADAFDRLLSSVNECGEVVIDENGVRSRGVVDVARRMTPAWAALDDAARAARLDAVRRRFAERIDAGDVAGAIMLADVLGFCEAGAEADLALARRELHERMPESAEFYLRRALDRPGSTGVAAEAAARWARLLTTGRDVEFRNNGPLARCMARLRELPADAALPSDVFASPPSGNADVGAFLEQLAGLESAASRQVAARQDGSTTTLDGATTSPATDFVAWRPDESDDPRILRTGMMTTGDGLYAVELAGPGLGGVRWQMLLPANEADSEGPRFMEPGLPLTRIVAGLARPAAAGAYAAVPTPQGVCFVGVNSGAAMCRPITPPLGRAHQMPDNPVAAARGMFVVAVSPNAVAGLPARNGASPLWRRTLGLTRLGGLHAIDDAVVAYSPLKDVLWVLDPFSGETLRRLDFPEVARSIAQDQPPDQRVVLNNNLAILLLAEGLRAVDMTTGETAWRVDVNNVGPELFASGPRHVTVREGLDGLVVVSVDDGARVGRISATEREGVVESAVMTDAGRLLLVRESVEARPELRLEWYDVGSGEKVRTLGPWQLALLTPHMLLASPSVLPVVRLDLAHSFDEASQAFESAVTTRVGLYDKSGGRRIGRPVALDPSEVSPYLADSSVLEVVPSGNRALVVTPERRFVVRFDEDE
ncbi:MAG: PQQ-like beta-propeller repeat protein [Phycisphaerae bacterium]|nr:PQQ-like beta-propeller repeat protein [Phycisphaerae bacterium]